MSYPIRSNHLLFVKYAVIADQVYFHVLEYFCVVHYNRALEYRLPLPIWFKFFSKKRKKTTHYYYAKICLKKYEKKNEIEHRVTRR